MGSAGGNGSTAALPAPPVPPDCDLRDLPAIMLHRSIFDSELAMMSTGDEFKAAILLYGASYGQIPAGSLPADDRALAFLSRTSTAKWPKVKVMALRGWYQAGDGRLYHNVNSEKVLIAWISRLHQRLRSMAGGAKKNNTGRFDRQPIEGQIVTAYQCLGRVAPDSREYTKWLQRQPQDEAPDVPEALPEAVPQALPQAQPGQCEAEGEGEGRGKGPSHKKGEVVPIGAAAA